MSGEVVALTKVYRQDCCGSEEWPDGTGNLLQNEIVADVVVAEISCDTAVIQNMEERLVVTAEVAG